MAEGRGARAGTGIVAALLFGSGFCALAYQTTWFREFRLIFGASTAASAAVLAVFMGGLGLGGALLGRRVDRSANGLRFYARLELFIALAAALTPLFLFLARAAYVASGGSSVFGTAGATAIRLFLTLFVLAIPTVLMGGTLPAAARAVESGDDRGRRRLAALYGANTLGAVTGALAGTFGMLETFGNRTTLLIAALLNVLIAVVALSVARTLDDDAPAIASAREVNPTLSARRPRFVLAAAAIVGFAFFLMEIVWYRMLGPLLGGSTFTFGLILAVALAGIGAGGLLYSAFGRSRPATLRAFAVTCAAEALLIALPFAAGDGIAVLAVLLRRLGAIGFGGYVAGWSVISMLVVFPAAVIAGFQFPLLIGLLGEGGKNVGRDAGAAYAWNTAGAIGGSLAGGFGILPLLTATGTWGAVVALLVLLALATVIVSWRDEGGRLTLAFPAVLAGGALLCFTALGPTAVWRHSPIGAGRADASDSSGWRNWMHDQRRNVTWEVEGIESSVGLASEAGYAFIVNGKSDGHFRSDAPTQVMGGLIGAAIHPNPKRAFVIGLGTGSTAGWLAQVPSMERVDVAELEPGILHVATLAAPVNADAMRNPRLRVRLGDAREMLLTTRDRYDIVFSEPSNPYRAGVASLFTRDFYEAVEGRLRPGGIFLQWVQSYEIDAPTVRTVYATLAAVFDHVESWQSHTGDLILLASNAPRRYEATVLRERLKEEPFRAAMHAAWRTESLEGFLSRYLASEKFTNVLLETGSTPVNTDDRNRIEFEAARSVGTESRFDIAELRAAATGIAAHRPAIAGAVDWKRVDQERLVIHSGAGGSPSVAAAGDDEALERRGRAHGAWVKGRLDTALDDWKRCCTQPINSLEIALVAEIASDAAEPPAAAWIDRLAWEDGVEADLIRARLLWRQQRLDDAAAYLVRGYEAHRKDPWPLPFIVSRSFNIAELTATERPDLAPAIHDALSKPFALRSLDYQRRMTAFAIARRLEKSCGPRVLAGIREFEPWVPWTRDFLEIRARCYQEARDPRAAEASRHLDELLAREPKPLLP